MTPSFSSSVPPTVTILHNWPLFVRFIRFLITVTIIKLENIVIIELI